MGTVAFVVVEAFDAYSDDPLAGMIELFREQRAGLDVVGGFINCVTVREATIETYIAGVINEPAFRVPLAA